MHIYGSSRSIPNTLKGFNLLLFGFGTLFYLIWSGLMVKIVTNLRMRLNNFIIDTQNLTNQIGL